MNNTIYANSFEYPADEKEIESIRLFVEDILSQFDCSENVILKIQLAIEELFVNISSYAYSNEKGYIHIDFDITPDTVYVTLKDNGIAFNPLLAKKPDITLGAEERPVGGLGIFLVKKFMDDVLYKYEDNTNVVTLVKKYQ